MSTKLIYLSPVPYNSFSQRPHYFVEWYHSNFDAEVIWINPFLTRLPKFSDLLIIANLFFRKKNYQSPKKWLKVFDIYALPIEPLFFINNINKIFWYSIKRKINFLYKDTNYNLVIGKPSTLAIFLLKNLKYETCTYDMLDNFPHFYKNLSKIHLTYVEKKIKNKVNKVICSSENLILKNSDISEKLVLVKNGLGKEYSINLIDYKKNNRKKRRKKIYGYVGTVGYWFDWDWILELARQKPFDNIIIVGPQNKIPNKKLPNNIFLYKSITNKKAKNLMSKFDVGLIPFKINPLTECIDPIKYYEYIALGLPVISTSIKEMLDRQNEDGLFISHNLIDINYKIKEALNHKPKRDYLDDFIKKHNFSKKLNMSGIF